MAIYLLRKRLMNYKKIFKCLEGNVSHLISGRDDLKQRYIKSVSFCVYAFIFSNLSITFYLSSIFSWMGDCPECSGRSSGHFRGIIGIFVVHEKTIGGVLHHAIKANVVIDFILQTPSILHFVSSFVWQSFQSVYNFHQKCIFKAMHCVWWEQFLFILDRVYLHVAFDHVL